MISSFARRMLPAFGLVVLLVGAGCSGGNHSVNINPTVTDPNSSARAQNATNFSRVYFLGDSLTAGFQNGSLIDDPQGGQKAGFANLIAQQARFNIVLPLVAPPGAPNELMLVSPGPPPVLTTRPGMTAGRENPMVQATDLAVPGHKVQDVISTRPNATPAAGQQQLDALVLGVPGLALNISRSQLEWAEALDATTIFVWIGNNDALVADSTGKPSSMTSLSAFTASYQSMIAQLLQNTKAHLIIANIPDVTLVPYLTPAPVVLAELSAATGIPTANLSALLGIQAGDLVNPEGISEAQAILHMTQAPPISDAGFLSAAEVAQVQAQVQSYNQVIAAQAQLSGATLIDVHALFAQLAAGGITVNGRPVTNQFLGNAFSLDGIHPSNTGYALLANYFIDNMNAQLKTTIADVNVSQIAMSDPLFHAVENPAGAHISVDAGKQVDKVINH